MALTQQELEEYRNYKRRLDMAQTPQGEVALRLAERRKKEGEARSALLKRCGAQADENPILKYYK